jgi:hypothetical protein
MPTSPQIIHHPAELENLSVLPIRRRPGQRRVAIAENLIASPDRERLEQELNRRLFACGCVGGTFGVILALIVYLVWAFVAAPDVSILGHLGRGLAALVAGGFIGKLAGLFVAENRLKETIARVRRAIPANAVKEPAPLPDGVACY